MNSFRNSNLCQVPNELWLDIFRRLPRDTIKALFLTSIMFKDICRSFLFAHFVFHPYLVDTKEGILLPPTIAVERALERLDFWTSDDIAPHVRSCKITPWQRPLWHKDGLAWVSYKFFATDSPHILTAPFFERLGKFTHLRNLHAEEIHFTQSAVASLYRAPSPENIPLEDVRLVRCNVSARERMDTPSGLLAISRFSYIHDESTIKDEIRLWIPILRPDSTHELELRCDAKLNGTRSYDLSILSHFPAVEIFSTNLSPDLPVNSTILPILRQYTGPCETMALFLPRSTLTRLTTLPCHPRAFREQLNGIQGSNNISFNSASGFDTNIIKSIRTFFPKLTELHICISHIASGEVSHNIHNIHNMVAMSFIKLGDPCVLPAELERIVFTWKIKYPAFRSSYQVEVPEFNDLRDALVRYYPTLKMFWFDGHNFLLCWRKFLDGLEEEGVAPKSIYAQDMREEFHDFCKIQRKPGTGASKSTVFRGWGKIRTFHGYIHA